MILVPEQLLLEEREHAEIHSRNIIQEMMKKEELEALVDMTLEDHKIIFKILDKR